MNNIKKILIIENRPDYGLGGVEWYNFNLIQIIKKQFPNSKIDRAYLLENFDKNNHNIDNDFYKSKSTHLISTFEKWNRLLFNIFIGFHILGFRKLIYKLNKINNYDLIIDSTIVYFNKFINNKKYIWIQHVTPSFYTHDYVKNYLYRHILLFSKEIFGVKNPVVNNKNIVCFDNNNKNEIINFNINDNLIINEINLFSKLGNYDDIFNNLHKRKKIIFFGRIENSQKNINLLIKLNKKLGDVIDFYGSGDKKIIKKLGNNYKGTISKDDIEKTIQKYKATILLSKYEGFPFSFVESLSNGVPIITNLSFASSSYLLNDNKNGIGIRSNNLSELSLNIKKFMSIPFENYKEICINSYSFAKLHFQEDEFKNKWIRIMNDVINS